MINENTKLYFFKSLRMKIQKSDKIHLSITYLSGKYAGKTIQQEIIPIDFNFNSISISTNEQIGIGTEVKVKIKTKKFFKRWDFEVKGFIIRSFLLDHASSNINYGIKFKKQTDESELHYFLKDFIYSCSATRIKNYFINSATSIKDYSQQDGVEFYSLLSLLYKEISRSDIGQIIDVSTHFLKAKEGRIYKININNDKLETYKHSTEADSTTNDFREGFSGKVFTSGQLINFNNTDLSSSTTPTQSLLAFPLVNRKNQRVGVIEFKDKIDGRFTKRDEATIKYLSEIISLYFKNYLPHSKNSHVTQLNPILKDDSLYLGLSNNAKKIHSLLDNLKNTDSNILIVGETGVGKNHLATQIHSIGQYSKNSLLSFDASDKSCVKKTFKNSMEEYRLEEKGTLIISNIEKLTLSEQSVLLNLVKYSKKRIISISKFNLSESTRMQSFNNELFMTLSESYIHLPPLRSRKDDLIYIATHFLNIECQRREIETLSFTEKNKKELLEYSWPSNIKELERTIKKYILKSLHSEDRELDLALKNNSNKSNSSLPNKNSNIFRAFNEITNQADLSIELKATHQMITNIIKKVS